jgi:hypothetical protein
VSNSYSTTATRILSLGVVTVTAFCVSLGFSLAIQPELAVAQEIGCAYAPCDHACDAENELNWDDLVWAIVKLEPEIDGETEAGDWYDSSGDSFVKLEVTGVWEPNSGSSPDHTETVTVQTDASCTGTAPNIKCHSDVVGVSSPDVPLCDEYSGKWLRTTKAASTCVDYYTYSFDFQQQLDIGGTIYCFKKVEYQHLNTSTIKGRSEDDCLASDPSGNFDTQQPATGDDCNLSLRRTGSSKNYIYTYLRYDYYMSP